MSENTKNPFFPNGFQLPDFANGTNPVMQGLEMMNKVWGGLGTMNTGMGTVMPTMDVEEIERRVTELRAVENWLRVNQAMLQSTIQGLEVQRATLATLQSYAGTTKKDDETVVAKQTQVAAQAWWDMMQDQFAQLTTAATQGMSAVTSATEKMVAPKKASTTTRKTTSRKKS